MKYRDIHIGQYYDYHFLSFPSRTMAYVVDKDLISVTNPGCLTVCLWTALPLPPYGAWNSGVTRYGNYIDPDQEIAFIVKHVLKVATLCPISGPQHVAAGVGGGTPLPSAPIFYDKVMVGHYYWAHAGSLGNQQATLIYIEAYKINVSQGTRHIDFFTWGNRTGTWMRASMLATNPSAQWVGLDRHEPNPPHVFGATVSHVAVPNPPVHLIASPNPPVTGYATIVGLMPLCECGVDKCGGIHSSWCPKGKSCSPSS